MFDPLHVYGFDIETDTTPIVGPDGQPGYNPGLDPLRGSVTEIVLATSDPATSGVLDIATHLSEGQMLLALDEVLDAIEPGLLATWGGGNFDIPFLHTRAQAHLADIGPIGLRPTHQDGLSPKYDPIAGHGPLFPGLDGRLGHSGVYTCVWERIDPDGSPGVPHQHLDVAHAYRAFAAEHGIKWGLKPVCQYLGIEMIEVDREEMHLLTPAEREAYVLSDGNGTRRLALRLLGHPDWMDA